MQSFRRTDAFELAGLDDAEQRRLLFEAERGPADTMLRVTGRAEVRTARRAVRAFNIVMAVLLLASLYPVFMDA